MPDLGPGGNNKIPQSPALESIDQVGKSKLTDDAGTDLYLNNSRFGNTVDQQSVRVINKTVQGYDNLYIRENDFGLRLHKFISPNNSKTIVDMFEVFAEDYRGKPIRFVNHVGLSIKGFLDTNYKLVELPATWCAEESLYKINYDIEFTVIECL